MLNSIAYHHQNEPEMNVTFLLSYTLWSFYKFALFTIPFTLVFLVALHIFSEPLLLRIFFILHNTYTHIARCAMSVKRNTKLYNLQQNSYRTTLHVFIYPRCRFQASRFMHMHKSHRRIQKIYNISMEDESMINDSKWFNGSSSHIEWNPLQLTATKSPLSTPLNTKNRHIRK